MGPTVRVAKIFGIPIEIHFSWIFGFLLLTLLLGNQFGHFHPTWTVLGRWTLALAISVLFFASVLAHELSHSLVAVRNGIPVQGITLFFFGGVSQLAHEARRPYIEFLITVVGPLSRGLLAGVFGALWYFFRDSSASLEVAFRLLMSINLMLGVFNMLPGFPLDGGRVLRSVIWGFSGRYWLATQVAARAGQLIGGSIAIGGGSLAIFDFRLFGLSGIWMILIGGFLFSAATATYRQERANERLKAYRVVDVMNGEWWTLPGEMLMNSPLVRQGLAEHNDLLAVSLNGRVEGMITSRSMAHVPKKAQATTLLSQAMLPLRSLPFLTPEDTASEAMDRMETGRLGSLAVYSYGELVGFVSRDGIAKLTKNRIKNRV
ncbi:MAG: site-2 protease family protein [Dehalococcoidia bacterium]|nr:site-2 protease family protein [Dehalococcoidia bacterium]